MLDFKTCNAARLKRDPASDGVIDTAVRTTAHTLRLAHAKRLLDETVLSIARIAFEPGFGSVRRCNAAFLALYGHAPSRLRRSRR
jgi:transcriptional regulator GlxA family with amidase domain